MVQDNIGKYYEDFSTYIKKNSKNLEIEEDHKFSEKSTNLDANLIWTIIEPNPNIKETNQIK